ncbi:hypothetical protein E2C01_001333 [Portunus trituberculatus]|uniref:Uncharacterized protein n=1 Tax=Portunus trituberculatus TaxID=210409 RepID=A0A5B7CHB9_PORTR|nr:hypothetical protein [Portunus trituberculatus]
MEVGGESNGKRYFCKAGMFGERRRAVPSCPAGDSVTEHVNSAVSARVGRLRATAKKGKGHFVLCPAITTKYGQCDSAS